MAGEGGLAVFLLQGIFFGAGRQPRRFLFSLLKFWGSVWQRVLLSGLVFRVVGVWVCWCDFYSADSGSVNRLGLRKEKSSPGNFRFPTYVGSVSLQVTIW